MLGDQPAVPPFPSLNAGQRSLGARESKSASGDPLESTVITEPKVEAGVPRNPRTKF